MSESPTPDQNLANDIRDTCQLLLPLLRRRVDFVKDNSCLTEHVVYYIACALHFRATRRGEPVSTSTDLDRVQCFKREQSHTTQLLSQVTWIMDQIWTAVDHDGRLLAQALSVDSLREKFLLSIDIGDDVFFDALSPNLSTAARQSYKSRVCLEQGAGDLKDSNSLKQDTRVLYDWTIGLFVCWLRPSGLFTWLCETARPVTVLYPSPRSLVFPIRFWNSLDMNVSSVPVVSIRLQTIATIEYHARHMLRISKERGFQSVDIITELYNTIDANETISKSAGPVEKDAVLKAATSKPISWLPRCIGHMARHADILKHDVRKSFSWFAGVTRRNSSIEDVKREFYAITTQLYGRYPRVDYKSDIERLFRSYQSKSELSADTSEDYSTRCATMVMHAKDEFRRFIDTASNGNVMASSSSTSSSSSSATSLDHKAVVPFVPDIMDLESIVNDKSSAVGMKMPMCPIAFTMMIEEVKVVLSRTGEPPQFDISSIYHRYGLDIAPHAIRRCVENLDVKVTVQSTRTVSPVSLWLQYARQK